MMNTNTPYFRAALTIATIWTAIFAYLEYSGYREAYRSTEYAAYDIPAEDTYQCSSTVLDTTKPGFQFRDQTSSERSDCYGRAAKQHISLIESGNHFAFEQAWQAFGLKGVVPALLLLAIVAFWALISAGVTHASAGYSNWLRFGSTKPSHDSKDRTTD